MKDIIDLKPKDLMNIERFVVNNGCDIYCERVEKNVHGVSNITIWTNRDSFKIWQQEVDQNWKAVFLDDSMQHNIPSSQLCTNLDEYLTEWRAVFLNPIEGDRPFFRHYTCGSIGPTLLEDQEDLGMFGFVVYIFWPYRPHVYEEQGKTSGSNEENRRLPSNRNRKQTNRMTYDTPGNPKND
jgi:hypothetical protein